ncbi:hypothetical protein HY642_03120 [Candidatus Woesearchaeota archaeon]|nr:hypothetical protein [Candidatus Woesearchaeota archaeon]
MTREVPLLQIDLPLAEVDDSLGKELGAILQRHSATLSTVPGAAAIATNVGRSTKDIDAKPVGHVTETLDELANALNGNARFGDDWSPEHKQRCSAIMNAIAKYYQQGGELARQAKGEWRHKDQPAMATVLQEQGVLCTDDVVSALGDQICIAKRHEEGKYDANAWFLWNIRNGGYFFPAEQCIGSSGRERNLFFNASIVTSGTDELEADILKFKGMLTAKVLDAFTKRTPAASRIAADLPRLNIPQQIGEALQLVEYAQESKYFSSGEVRKGQVVAYDRSGSGFINSINHIVSTHKLTGNEYWTAGGWNADLVCQFLKPLSAAQILDNQAALAVLQQQEAKLAPEFIERFTGAVGPYQNPTGKCNIFPWFFYNWDCSRTGVHGYTQYVKYDRNQMPAAIDWLAHTAADIGKSSKHFAGVSKAARGFISGKAYTALQSLLGRSHKESFNFDSPSYGYNNFGSRRGFYEENSTYLRTETPDRADPTFTQLVQKQVTEPNREATSNLFWAMRQMEYGLVWARFFNKAAVPTAVPKIGTDIEDIAILAGRNLPLVLRKNAAVVPNDVHFNAAQHTMLITGANGGGKTQTLEMIANNQVLGHRGLRVLAKEMQTPALGSFTYGVNLSVHGEEASAYQNEVRKLINLLGDAAKVLPGEKGVMILDEPFRGTDRKDAIPLLIGMMRFLEERGVYFAYSTHFNHVGHQDELFKDFGIHAGVYTMDRQKFTMKPGVGRSEGVEVARELALEPEIVAIADKVARAGDAGGIELKQKKLKQAQTRQHLRPLSDQDLLELGIYVQKESTHDWGKHNQIGSATRVFAEHSMLKTSEYTDKGAHQYLPSLRPDAAHAFIELLTAPLSDNARSSRVKTLDMLVQQDELCARMHANIDGVKEYALLFSLYQGKKKKGMEAVLELYMAGIAAAVDAGQRAQDERIQYERFLSATSGAGLQKALQHIHDLADALHYEGLTASKPERDTLDAFLKSPAHTTITEFIAQHGFLCGKADKSSFSMDNWKDWVNLCVDNEQELIDVHKAVLRTNFYATVGTTLREQHWQKPESADTPSAVVSNAVNTRLAYTVPQVAPVDINLDESTPVNIVSGTNGGGKTQFLQLVGSTLYLNEQLGYVPATEARIGNYAFLYAMLSTAEHSQEQSSFQNEVTRMRDAIKKYQDAGSMGGGIVLLDEPFKGTSEEEAIPLLTGLVKYFERRNVQLVFTTHFSGIFDTLGRLDAKSRVACRPLYVDYFAEPFKVKEGVGSSSGIRVAEQMGLPKEIIATARKVYARMTSV